MIAALAAIPAGERQELLRSAFALWAVTAIVGFLAILCVWVILSGYRRRRLSVRAPKEKRAALPDAWAEAGRRLEAEEPEEEPDDEDDLR